MGISNKIVALRVGDKLHMSSPLKPTKDISKSILELKKTQFDAKHLRLNDTAAR